MKKVFISVVILLGFSGASSDDNVIINRKSTTLVMHKEENNVDNLAVKTAELDSLLLELKKYKHGGNKNNH